VTETSKYFQEVVNVLLLDQSLYRLKANTEVFNHHRQKQIHQHESNNQNEQNEVQGSGSLISAVADNQNLSVIAEHVLGAKSAATYISSKCLSLDARGN
jgi:hypothetical protein